MENTEMILEGMIAIQENELEMLYEAVVTAKWSSVDKSACMAKIKEVDAKYPELTPVKTANSLTDDEKKKIGRKFGLKKVGSTLLTTLTGAIGAGAGAATGTFIGSGAAKKTADTVSKTSKNLKDGGQKGTALAKNLTKQAVRSGKANTDKSVMTKRAGIAAAGGAAFGAVAGGVAQRNKYVETNCNGRLCYVGENGSKVKVSLVYRTKEKKITIKSFSI